MRGGAGLASFEHFRGFDFDGIPATFEDVERGFDAAFFEVGGDIFGVCAIIGAENDDALTTVCGLIEASHGAVSLLLHELERARADVEHADIASCEAVNLIIGITACINPDNIVTVAAFEGIPTDVIFAGSIQLGLHTRR